MLALGIETIIVSERDYLNAGGTMNHRKEIMNYFHDRITNAICEGINSLVQAAKRKARGFNTFDGLRAMIFLVGGKLKLDLPSPF